LVVKCPKCQVKLNIPDEKIASEGSRFKCPKCTTVLLVKRPSERPQEMVKPKQLDKNKVLLALGAEDISQKIRSLLTGDGFNVITTSDGVDTMVKAAKELPYTAIVDVALPKIYGFEVCKRLKTALDTKDIKVILYTSIHDKLKYRRPPSSLYGADGYIEDHETDSILLQKVHSLLTGTPPVKKPEAGTQPAPATQTQTTAPLQQPRAEAPAAPQVTTPAGAPAGGGEWIDKAKRLARTVLADVFLYNPQKAEDALRSGNFLDIFTGEINEGRKLYESRIPQDVRSQGDFFQQEVLAFLEGKKKSLNI
jgi:predicted Zn finger-like uncharacterized protein